ncbi:MAG: DUF3038 domain-containing protein [Cyanobacteriota bacterium]|nr:DUF3038 domain-containing protein [Cyanobacteriota bacterium]
MPEASVLPAIPSPPAESLAGRSLPRRGLERLDLLLLAVEALDLNSGEAMLWMSEQLGVSELFPNRVELWKRRCTNPLRRTPSRSALDQAESEALIRLVCAMADRVYPLLRALLSSVEPPEITNQRWSLFQTRFIELVRERLNPRRGAVQALLDPDAGPLLHHELIQSLALAAGPGGVERLWASLLDAAA